MKLSSCIDIMFTDIDFYDRFAKAKEGGVTAVEFWSWPNKDIQRVKEELEKNELDFAAFTMSSRNEAFSKELGHGILNAGRKREFLAAIEENIPVYRELNAAAMIVLIGQDNGTGYEKQVENVKECLAAAAPLVEKENVNLVVEPLNTTERPNYVLPRSKEVFEILKEVNSPNIKLLFDMYHEQLMAGNLINSIRGNLPYIGHIHIADVPDRNEPGTGELNYKNIFKVLTEMNYQNYIGMEFRSTQDAAGTVQIIREIQKWGEV